MTIAEELLSLKNDEGMIVAEAAVQWASENPQSALYGSLQWDDTEAANQWRIWQVRRLISIHIVNEDKIRQLVSLTIDRGNKHGGGYREMNDVLERPDLRTIMLDDALKDLDRIQQKYSKLEELAKVWTAKDRVKKRRTRTTQSAVTQSSAQQSRA